MIKFLFRLKNSQRSTPSLNSSKLSTETVGTATATMISSVGSGSRNGTNNVAKLLNGTTCKLPQMYHSATISRRAFPPTSHYYLQQQQQHLCQHNNNSMRLCESSCNCCNCMNAGCCYATAIIGNDNADSQQQQQIASRIYNSKSATNIFGSGCLTQQRQLHHLQCTLSGNTHLSQFNHYQHCGDGTLMK